MKKVAKKLIYCTTFCNQAHRIDNGHPVNHECYILKPEALKAEMEGDFTYQPFRTDRILKPKQVEICDEEEVPPSVT